jgi:hypothetical protein
MLSIGHLLKHGYYDCTIYDQGKQRMVVVEVRMDNKQALLSFLSMKKMLL